MGIMGRSPAPRLQGKMPMMIDLDAIRRALTTDFQSLWKENERLRAALLEIIQKDAFTGETVFVGDYGKIARAALGEKHNGND